MKQIAEQNRKFIDMVDIKVHHSIYPIVFPPVDANWGPIIRFDDKIILPGRQDIQNFTGAPIQIVRIMVNGAAAYYDSTGYRKVLKEKDTLVVGYGKDAVQSIMFNYNEAEENELLEIWLTTSSSEKRCQFFPSKNGEEQEIQVKLTAPALSDEVIDVDAATWLLRGTFRKNMDHTITAQTGGDRLILFVLSGSMTVNDNLLTFRDAVILSLQTPIDIHFIQETDLLLIQLKDKEDIK